MKIFSFAPASLRKGPISSAVFLLFRPPVCNTIVSELTYYFVLILHIKLGFNKHIKVMEHNLTFFFWTKIIYLNQNESSERLVIVVKWLSKPSHLKRFGRYENLSPLTEFNIRYLRLSFHYLHNSIQLKITIQVSNDLKWFRSLILSALSP